MPRVPEAHLAARRQHILDAARACFIRNGFHMTSMQDVIAEAGVSVGAVYRYFRSKSDIVAAIAEQYSGEVHSALARLVADRSLALGEVMRGAVQLVDASTGPDGVIRLAVQVWAEALRDEHVAVVVERVYGRIRGTFVEAARHGVQTGELPAATDPETAGAALFSLVIGYALQRLLTGGPDRDAYATAVDLLLSLGRR